MVKLHTCYQFYVKVLHVQNTHDLGRTESSTASATGCKSSSF